MLIKVRVFPESKEEKILQKDESSFDVYVREKTQRGEANSRVQEVLCEHFNVGGVKLVKGHRRRSKVFEVY